MELFNLGIKMEQPASKEPEALGRDKTQGRNQNAEGGNTSQ